MNKKITAVLLSALMACGGMASCSKSKSDSSDNKSSAVPEKTTAAPQPAETTVSTTIPATKAAVTTKITTKKSAVVTATQPDSTETTTVPVNVSGSGYTDSLTLASDFYQAYLDHEPEKVYEMFNEQEIKCYKELMADELEGKSPDEVFSKESLIKAIDASMVMIEEIMAEFSDSENDRWTADISEGLFTEVTEEELSAFNEDLGTDYTKGTVINYMYYVNADNGEPFVGNSSAFLENNGQWYVSFSSLMQSELINQLEV